MIADGGDVVVLRGEAIAGGGVVVVSTGDAVTMDGAAAAGAPAVIGAEALVGGATAEGGHIDIVDIETAGADLVAAALGVERGAGRRTGVQRGVETGTPGSVVGVVLVPDDTKRSQRRQKRTLCLGLVLVMHGQGIWFCMLLSAAHCLWTISASYSLHTHTSLSLPPSTNALRSSVGYRMLHCYYVLFDTCSVDAVCTLV